MNLDAHILIVNARLEELLPGEESRPHRLHAAMRYSMFAGGKRLRPILCLGACEAIGGESGGCLSTACALEMLHTFSLIHDDLPCMDNDELRRGKPTCHVAFGEAMALLAGDALMVLAFEIIGGANLPAPYSAGGVVRELASAVGHAGMVGGQIDDMEAERNEVAHGPDLLQRIHKNKTAAFIRASVRIGGMCGGASTGQLETLGLYGFDIGLAFQIVDDILNVTGSPEELGKAVGSDAARGKLTYPKLYGLDESRRKADELLESAVQRLAALGGRTEFLADLARFVGKRSG